MNILEKSDRMDIIEEIRNEVIKRSKLKSNVFTTAYEYHIKIVVQRALELAKLYYADIEIVELAALLHDIASITNKDFVEEHHITTLMITHNMEDALKYGNKTMIMKDGKIIALVEGEQREKMSVDELIHLYSTSTHDYNDRLFLR